MGEPRSQQCFQAIIKLIGINPYVSVPEAILENIFIQAGRNRSPIPIHGLINEKPFTQTLVKFQGEWRLYINTLMLKNSPKHIGETVHLIINFNSTPPKFTPPPSFLKALADNPQAKEVFDKLPTYLQKEINKYLTSLKTQTSLDLNINRAVQFLLGKGRFIGRDKP